MPRNENNTTPKGNVHERGDVKFSVVNCADENAITLTMMMMPILAALK